MRKPDEQSRIRVSYLTVGIQGAIYRHTVTPQGCVIELIPKMHFTAPQAQPKHSEVQ